MKLNIKRISIRTATGLKRAERLHRAGWMTVLVSSTTVLMQR